MPADDI
ncbi:hypothetical protein AVEN_158913-1, partial [Araneus ventricosus]